MIHFKSTGNDVYSGKNGQALKSAITVVSAKAVVAGIHPAIPYQQRELESRNIR